MRMRSGKNFGADGLLDAPACPTTEIEAITVQNQQNSPLLRLPPEIRNRIFKYAVGGGTIYINFRDVGPKPSVSNATTLSRAASPSETEDAEDDGEPEASKVAKRSFCHHAISAAAPITTDGYGHPIASLEQPVKLSQLHLTCRQIYQETVLLLYSANLFCFHSYDAPFHWLRSLRPAQKRAITTLIQPTVIIWTTVFQQLKGLKTVYLSKEWVDATDPYDGYFVRYLGRKGVKVEIF